MKINLSDNARYIIDKLQCSGYSCYAVGGCVRDSLMGKEPHDWDFTTSAKPDEIERVFAEHKTIDIGKRFGTIAVVLDGKPYEITTYRVDMDYSDSRHPDEVSFSEDIRDDLSRRDFTVNAMAYNDRDGLIDLFEGQKDIEFGVIRCVGSPKERFEEDALRILRALRFASTLSFSIEPKTAQAILDERDELRKIAPERIRDELLKLLCGDNVGFVLRRYRTVIAVFIPQLLGTFDFDQRTKHHNRDVYRHTVAAVQNIEPDPLLRTVMLYHDIAKPLTQTTDKSGVGHYKEHQRFGAAIARYSLESLCMPKAFTNEVCMLIRYHDLRLKPEPSQIKRYMNLLGVDAMQKLYKIRLADTLAQSMYLREEKLQNLEEVKTEIERIAAAGECYNLKMLAVNGSDLLHMGMTSGERIGETLDALLEKVINEELPNEKSVLLSYVKNEFDKDE